MNLKVTKKEVAIPPVNPHDLAAIRQVDTRFGVGAHPGSLGVAFENVVDPNGFAKAVADFYWDRQCEDFFAVELASALKKAGYPAQAQGFANAVFQRNPAQLTRAFDFRS